MPIAGSIIEAFEQTINELETAQEILINNINVRVLEEIDVEWKELPNVELPLISDHGENLETESEQVTKQNE